MTKKETGRFLLLTMAAATLSIHVFAQGMLWGMTSEGGSEHGLGGGGVIFKTNADGTSYMSVQKVFQFDYPGERPQSMVMAPNGKFYGTTNSGGMNQSGLIFEYDPTTGEYYAVYHFKQATGYLPNAGLMLASNGKLYGTTPYGGSDGRGVIYEFDPATGIYQVVFTFLSSFGNQPRSGLIQTANGRFYGTAPWGGSGIYGVIYEFNLATRTAIIKHNFTTASGSAPSGPVIQASNGKLYGMTPEGGANNLGVVYEYDLTTSTYTKHADLSEASGRNPNGGLTESSVNGKLYGLTMWGGANGEGAVIQFDPATGVFQSIVALGTTLGGRPMHGFTEAPNGKLYCVTNIRLLELNPATAGVTQRAEFLSGGTNSGGTLTKAYNGKLYGVGPVSISGNRGTIFSFDYTTNTHETKINYNKATNGAYPLGNLVKAANGKLYGTVSKGGPNDLGFIFELDPATGVFTKKIDFTGTNGATPSAGMSAGTNGKLYGMTTHGGSQGLGVLFEYDPASNTFTKKKDFTTPNGQHPTGELTLASNGKFYGLLPTNFESPATGYLFEYDPTADALQLKIPFSSNVDGRTPDGTLTQAANGKLYGTTTTGGTNGSGVLFEYDPATNTYTKKIDFSTNANLSESSIGTHPIGKLALTADGKLYGMTTFGGYAVNFNNTAGTIFAFDPATGVLTRKHRFGCATGACSIDGFNPRGSLVLAPDNKLYGMTSSGGQQSLYGVAFQFDPATSVYTKKFDFTQANGASPRSNSLIFIAGMMDQSITFAAPEAKTISDGVFNLSATASSGLPVTLLSSDPGVATISGNTVTIKGVGSTVITASQPGNSDYKPAAIVTHTLEVSKSGQTISFTLAESRSFGDVPFTLQGTSSSGLPLTYSSSNTAVATVSGNIVTIVSPGTTTIKANQAGNDIFAAAAEVSQSLTVQKAAQTITFNQSLTKKFAEASLTLTATASSGLPVTYVSADPAIATISGSVVTFVARGEVGITASQPGNDHYEAANTSRTLIVENSSPVVVKSIPQQEALQLMPFTFTFDAGVFNDPDHDAITYSAQQESAQPLPAWLTFNASTRTFSGTPGTADRTVDVQLKATDAFNGSGIVSFKIAIAVITSSAETTPDQELHVYPNPVQHTLVIQHQVPGETPWRVVIRSSVGGTVYENKSPENRAEVDTAQWQPGVYLVEVCTDKTVRQTKIIKL